MPPTLRSASSPANKSRTSNATALDDDTPSTTPTATPRKVPHCTKCGRPRAGHPRQGCPFADSPQSVANNISDALETLHIEHDTPVRAPQNTRTATATRPRRSLQPSTPIRDSPGIGLSGLEEANRATIRLRRQSAYADLRPTESVNSLSTASSEILGNLQLAPDEALPMDDEEIRPNKVLKDKIVRWQDTLVILGSEGSSITTSPGEKKLKARTPMPGALMTPSPYSSTTIPPEPEDAKPIQSYYSDTRSQVPSDVSTSRGNQSTVVFSRAKPLARSMSMEEREAFMDFIHNAPQAAQVYRLPKTDIPAIQQAAARLKYFARVINIVSDDADSSVPEGYIIIGKDEATVRKMVYSLYYDERDKKGDAKSSLRAAAGGAVVGAVATFTGLAFT